MSFSFKILPALALAVALSPVAAQAHSAVSGDHAALNNQVRVSEVTPGSATIDKPTIIYSGVNANSFRDSVGG
jgi:hypothetical protein